MVFSAPTEASDIRIRTVQVSEHDLCVGLMDGRTITAPLAWYPRLAAATQAQRQNWELSGAGDAIHWPDIDEDLSTQGLLRGTKAPPGSKDWKSPLS